MFNLLVSGNSTAWETAQPLSMLVERFKEGSGSEGEGIAANRPESLKVLEKVPALLLYEWAIREAAAQVVRYGFLHNINKAGRILSFGFRCEGFWQRDLIEEFAAHLGLVEWERNRTHWAIKDGDIPRDLLRRMNKEAYRPYRYEVVLSYAGENETYVKEVAALLKEHGVTFFFAPFKEAELWGAELTEELDLVYRMDGRYCVMFISEHYAKKAWPTAERRSALARAIEQRNEYILPARFDDTEVPGLRPTIGYVDLSRKSPEELGRLILEKIGRKPMR